MNNITEKLVWDRYQQDMEYKNRLELERRVKQQENFFIGRQWEGVNAPDLPKPVLNIVKRVTNYLISVLVVDDIGIAFRNYNPLVKQSGEETIADGDAQAVPVAEEILPAEVERINERVKLKVKLRSCLRNAAVDGDTALYVRFDTRKGVQDGGQTKGEIDLEIIDNTNIHFGFPLTGEVEKQPYIIISRLEQTSRLKKQFPHLADRIWPDGCTAGTAEADDVTTVLIYMYKHGGRVWFCQCTERAMLTAPVDSGLSLYPVAYMSWEKVKNQYHGVGVVEEVIPNQIEINKLWAMALLYQKNNAFPKVFYDKTKIDRWDNRVGGVVGVIGNPNDAFASSFKPSDMSNQVMQLVERTISHTKELMGANDAVLGNVNPQNTSALIQVQKASAAPLELQRLSFYQFIEDYIRIVLDIIRTKYGIRRVCGTQGGGWVDFSALDFDREINVDIGASAYFSEAAQIQTMDNLFKAGIITDARLFVESLPDKALPNKNKILQQLKQQEQPLQEQLLQAAQDTPQADGAAVPHINTAGTQHTAAEDTLWEDSYGQM